MEIHFNKIKNIPMSDNPNDSDFKKLDEAITIALGVWETECEGKTEFEKFSWVRGFIWGYLTSQNSNV